VAAEARGRHAHGMKFTIRREGDCHGVYVGDDLFGDVLLGQNPLVHLHLAPRDEVGNASPALMTVMRAIIGKLSPIADTYGDEVIIDV
jgi:hypothetical protein